MEEEDIDPLNIFERRLNSVTKIEQVFDFKSFDFKALFTECWLIYHMQCCIWNMKC